VEVVAYQLANAPEAAEIRLSIGARSGAVSVDRLEVTRDVYYLSPLGRSDDWEMDEPLGEDEYFLLGDNAPNSVDSRHYGPIRREALVGDVRLRSVKTAAETVVE
jgi:type IV secretory pathway protease TraF